MPFTNQDPNLHGIFRQLEDRILKNENAKRFTSPPIAQDPAAGMNGDIWLNTTDNDLAYKDASGNKQVVATTADLTTKQPTVTTQTNALTTAVTMSSANTFYAGASLTLAAGTWLVTANHTIASASNTAQSVTSKLYNGTTTVYASGQGFSPAGGAGVVGYVQSTLTAIVTLVASTTITFAAASTASSSVIKVTPDNNNTNATNTAAIMTALKFA
jgi:hypothetical protein